MSHWCQFDLSDPSGWRLSVVWSRSGKTVGVAGIRSAPWGYVQVGLNADEIRALADFLGDDDSERGTELQDPEDADARLQAAWNHRHDRLTFTIVSRTPFDGDPPEIRLDRDDVAALASFLNAGPTSAT